MLLGHHSQAPNAGTKSFLSMDLSQTLELADMTDIGRHRHHNEDSSAIDPSIGLAVIADGMGGYKAGEVASAVAVTSILAEVKRDIANLMPGGYDESTGYAKETMLIKRAIFSANSAILKMGRADSRCEGMGTTVVAMLFHDNRVSIAHVGDSRLYRLRGGKFKQLTTDHTLVQELINRRYFAGEEQWVQPPKNLLTRALGIAGTVEVDVLEDVVVPGDLYMMCTDGLNDMVDDEEIRLTLCKYSANLVVAAQKLVHIANQGGGRDNISVVLARPTKEFPARLGWYSRIVEWFSLD